MYFEIIVGSHGVVRNSTDSLQPSLSFPQWQPLAELWYTVTMRISTLIQIPSLSQISLVLRVLNSVCACMYACVSIRFYQRYGFLLPLPQLEYKTRSLFIPHSPPFPSPLPYPLAALNLFFMSIMLPWLFSISIISLRFFQVVTCVIIA